MNIYSLYLGQNNQDTLPQILQPDRLEFQANSADKVARFVLRDMILEIKMTKIKVINIVIIIIREKKRYQARISMNILIFLSGDFIVNKLVSASVNQ